MTVHPLSAVVVILTTLAVLQLPLIPGSGAAAALAVVCSALGALAARRSDRSAVIVFCLCLVPGRALYEASRWQESLLPAACEREPLLLSGRVRGLTRVYPQGEGRLWRITLDVDSLAPEACGGPQRVRLYLTQRGEGAEAGLLEPFPPGRFLTLEARLRRPWGLVNPAAADGERDYLPRGIHAVGSAKVAGTHTSKGDETVAEALGNFRLTVSQWIRAETDEHTGPLLAALAVGDQRWIAPATWTQLRAFGLTHLLVISGLHVSLAAMPGWCIGALLSRLSGLSEATSRYPPVLLALAGAGCYAILAGLSLPTRRALLMLTLFCLPRLAGRPVDGAATLAMAVAILLFIDPLAVLGASFWLSCGAVALLLWFTRWMGTRRGLRQLVLMQGFLLAAMMPLSLFWFGGGSGAGAALNLIAIPMISLWTTPLLLAAVQSHGLGLSFASELLALSAIPLQLLLVAMAALQSIVGGASEPAKALPVAVLLLFLLAVMTLVIPGTRCFRSSAALLALPFLLSPLHPRPPRLEVTFLDVGQGTAVLFRAGHRMLLYDTGPGPADGPPIALRTVLPELRRYPGDSLEMLIISHPDLDHSAGEHVLRERTGVRELRRGIAPSHSRERCRTGRVERFAPGIELHYLSGAQAGDSDNNASCVLLVHAFGYRFLLAGDIDRERERDLAAYWGDTLRADVLLAAHHGSGGSTGRLWLRSVKPAFVVVTAARANRFGHPAPGMQARVVAQGSTLLNTAEDGAVVFTLDPGGELLCRRHRHARRAFWRRGSERRDCGTVPRPCAGIIAATRTGEPQC